MVKFEVGKVYETVDAFGNKITAKVIARSENFIITKCSYGNRKESLPLWDGENARPIAVVECIEKAIVNGIEKTTVNCIEKTIDSSLLVGGLSADTEAKPEEVKEEKEPICFEVGKTYLSVGHDKYICKAIIKRKNEKVGIFYNEEDDILDDDTIETKNNVEYTHFLNFPRSLTYVVNLIADEQYRDEIQVLI